jgi:hypothetical protein
MLKDNINHPCGAVAAAPDHRHRDRPFRIQAEILRDRRHEVPDRAQEVLTLAEGDRLSCDGPALSPRELTHCFVRLGNLDSGAFERLGRYNAALWKQTAQTLLLLGSVRRRLG